MRTEGREEQQVGKTVVVLVVTSNLRGGSEEGGPRAWIAGRSKGRSFQLRGEKSFSEGDRCSSLSGGGGEGG